MKIAIIGLGKMGHQLVVRLVNDGHKVIVLDRDSQLVSEAERAGAVPAVSQKDIIEKFGSDRPVVWLMIPAGAVDEELGVWEKLLPADSIIIDGGNSNFSLSKQRSERLSNNGIRFIDIGTSGGILGLKNGFSMMIGGDKKSVEQLDPILISLSKPNGAYHYFGESGSGHFVKMVHNAIEYGFMESMSEGYRLLKDGPFQNLDLQAVAEVWQHGSIIESSLNNLARKIFAENPTLDGIDGVVAESGEAKWSLETAHNLGIDMPAIQTSFDVRVKSQQGETNYATKFLAALRNKFGGHNINPKQ